jgi:hypothetical protein
LGKSLKKENYELGEFIGGIITQMKAHGWSKQSAVLFFKLLGQGKEIPEALAEAQKIK